MMSSSSRLLSLYQRTAAASLRSGTAVRCLSNPEEPFPIKEEYVHPLSQFVLQHLQQSRSDWVVKNGLDRGLTLQRDGTFELVFPSFPQDRARIWTSYDSKEKKHWLSVHKGDLVGRYLLQDNLAPAWHSSAKSTQEKICDAVDSLIEKIDEENNKKD